MNDTLAAAACRNTPSKRMLKHEQHLQEKIDWWLHFYSTDDQIFSIVSIYIYKKDHVHLHAQPM